MGEAGSVVGVESCGPVVEVGGVVGSTMLSPRQWSSFMPPLLPWEEIGDGSGYRVEGEPAEVVWRDPDRVREQFRRSLEYALRAVGGFAARRAGDPPLIVLLGDHQPASFVSEDPAGRDVPIHMIGRPEVLARIDGWGWTPGMVPAATAPVWDMEAFRDRFLDAFGAAPRLRSVAR